MGGEETMVEVIKTEGVAMLLQGCLSGESDGRSTFAAQESEWDKCPL